MSGHLRACQHTPPVSRKRKPGHPPEQPVRTKEFALTAGLLTSLCTLPFCLPYYLALSEESFEAVNQIAMDLDDEGSLRRLLLLNVVLVLKFLVTLLPIPLVAALAGLAPRGWQWLKKWLQPEWQKVAPASEFRRLFAMPHLNDVIRLSSKCLLILALLYLEILYDLAGFPGPQNHFMKQPMLHALLEGYVFVRMLVICLLLLALLRWRR